MLRTPRSLNVHATVEPDGEAIRLSGVGRLSTCSAVNGAGAGDCVASRTLQAATIVSPSAAPTRRLPIATRLYLWVYKVQHEQKRKCRVEGRAQGRCGNRVDRVRRGLERVLQLPHAVRKREGHQSRG